MRQTSLTKNHLMDLEQKIDKLIEIYVAVLGEKHRTKITNVLTEVPILFTGTNDKWIQILRKTEIKNKYSSGDKIVSVAEESKVESFIEAEHLDRYKALVQDSLNYLEKITDNLSPKSKEEVNRLFSIKYTNYTASCIIETSQDLEQLITFIHLPLEGWKDSVIIHEILHALSAFLNPKAEGKAIYGSGLTEVIKIEGTGEELLTKDMEENTAIYLNQLNELFTEYLTQKTISKMKQLNFTLLSDAEFNSEYNRGLSILSYLFEKIELELIDTYVEGKVEAFKNIIGAELFYNLIDVSHYFYDCQPEFNLMMARSQVQEVRTVKDMIKYADRLYESNSKDLFYMNCLKLKNITDEIVQKLNDKNL